MRSFLSSPPGVLLLWTVWLPWPYLAFGPFSYVRCQDNADSKLPGTILVAASLGNGAIGKWNPYFVAGTDTRATTHAPLNVIPFPVSRFPFPVSRFCCHARVVSDGESLLHAMGRADREELSRVVFVPTGLSHLSENGVEELGSESEVRVLSYSADRIEISVECSKACVLVVTNAYDSHWRATVDGSPVPLFPADYAFQASSSPPAHGGSSSSR